MPTKTETPAPPKQSVITVTYRDGTVEEYPLDPLSIYKASKEGAANAVDLTYTAAWISAGKPDGSVERWLANVASTTEDEREIPPQNGSRRS